MSLEAGEQIANMMAMSPYPGFEGEFFSMPCRDVIPKPVQKPHPTHVDRLHQPHHHRVGRSAGSRRPGLRLR